MGKFTLGSLFSGIGGLDLAAHWAGFETSWFVEKELFCQKVLNKHWPDIPVYGDVFECHDMPFVDVICGGFPCQPFSVAGNRKGKDDERYLLPEMLRIVDEVQPYAVLFENVPGFPSLNDGTEFKYLLGTLAEMGFDAEWGHIRASDIGATHQRERWFLVAYTEHDGHPAPTITGRDAETVHNHAQGTNASSKLEGSNSTRITAGPIMGNATSAGLERTDGREQTFGERPRPSYGRPSQPRIRRAFNGLPGRLDFVGFPARPGQPQYTYEPPRTAASTPTTNARIKALGNAVVPQCAYPIFEALVDWLEEVKNG